MGRSALPSSRIRADGVDHWVILADGAFDEAIDSVEASPPSAPAGASGDRQREDALIAAILASVTRKR